MKIPTFIICYNILEWTKDMLTHIDRLGGRPIIVNNASDYKPLLDWLGKKPCEVINLDHNYGHQAVWHANIAQRYCTNYYAVTDPDLDLSGIPDDGLVHLRNGLDRYPHTTKCGFSLEINDLPDASPVKHLAIGWETPFWDHKMPNDWQFWDAPIDTTMAVYDARRGFNWQTPAFQRATRADRPFTFRHLPFYLTEENMTEELWRYFTMALGASATLATHLKPLLDSYQKRHRK